MKSQTFGLTAEQFEVLRRVVLNPLLARPGTKLWIFGSRARGDYRPFSDIDLLIESSVQLPERLLGQVREAAEECALPFKVDLVRREDLAEGYREGILRDRIALG